MTTWQKEETMNQVVFSTSYRKTVDIEVIFDKNDQCGVVYVDGEMRDDIDLSDYDTIESLQKKLPSIKKEIKHES